MSLATYITVSPHVQNRLLHMFKSLLEFEFILDHCIFAWCKSLIGFEFVLVTKDLFLCMVTEVLRKGTHSRI